MQKWLIGSVAVLAIGTLLTALLLGTGAGKPPSPDVRQLVSALENGDISLGSDFGSWTGESFPIIDSWVNIDGERYSVILFYYRGEFVMLYARNNKLFAAQHGIGMTVQSKVKWYFVDLDIMTDYLKSF
jgi:hypothetical protein